MSHSQDELRARLNAETARIGWPELERHFARGVVIKVAINEDLVGIAARISGDDTGAVQALLDDGRVWRATLEDAKDWHARQPELWAVVTAPWVLVQESADNKSTTDRH